MYINYFRLNEPPFSLTPDPRYLFMSERHREGLAHLLYGVQQPGGFVQLTGEIGSGKTTLSRCLVSQLPADTDVALILNPRLTALELLESVCDELRIPHPPGATSIKSLIDALNRRLLEVHAKRRRTVLIIDEAQNLHPDVLEQIRLLTNLETSQEKLLQIILIGQPELLSILKRKKLRQLAQRVTARYHLLPLSRQETYAYIQHRLLVAGRSDAIFTMQAMRKVYRLSGGVPRLINIICDRALLGAYASDKKKVSGAIVRKASRETQGTVPRRRRLRLAFTAGAFLLTALIVGTAVFVKPSFLSGLYKDMPQAEARGNGADPETDRMVRVPPARAETAPQPAAASSLISGKTALPVQAAPALRLVDLLAGSPSSGDLASSFKRLFALWGIKRPPAASDLGCEAARESGFECLPQTGSWLKLRRYDIPAILEIMLASGQRRHVTLVELGEETATLAIGNVEHTCPLSEIDQVWDGSFLLIWKPPVASRRLSLGMRNDDVAWVRRTLDAIDGRPSSGPVPSLFDEELRQRVRAFQKSQALIQDGFVGRETLVRLSAMLGGSRVPSLSRRAG